MAETAMRSQYGERTQPAERCGAARPHGVEPGGPSVLARPLPQLTRPLHVADFLLADDVVRPVNSCAALRPPNAGLGPTLVGSRERHHSAGGGPSSRHPRGWGQDQMHEAQRRDQTRCPQPPSQKTGRLLLKSRGVGVSVLTAGDVTTTRPVQVAVVEPAQQRDVAFPLPRTWVAAGLLAVRERRRGALLLLTGTGHSPVYTAGRAASFLKGMEPEARVLLQSSRRLRSGW